MGIGFYRFNTEEERRKKQGIIDCCVGLDSICIGSGEDSFMEFIATKVNKGDIVYITSLTDLGNDILQICDGICAMNDLKGITFSFLSDNYKTGEAGFSKDYIRDCLLAFVDMLDKEIIE